MEDLFEKISRNKVRFETTRGLLTAEDLWDLPLTSTTGKPNLDDIAKGLSRQLRAQSAEVSFVEPEAKPDENIEVALTAVKHVILVKVTERKAAAEVASRREKKQLILGIIAQKENAALTEKSLDDLKAMVEGL